MPSWKKLIQSGSSEYLHTASVSSNTITFTKGDNSTFNITVDTGSGGSTPTGSLITTASSTVNTITFTKGDASTFSIFPTLTTSSITDFPTSVEAYITNGTTQGLLESTSNWTIDGVYTGSSITSTSQGQKHYDTAYFFEAVNDNLWIRYPRV